ncbi:hypothetical protein ACPUVO_02565 [Pseudocolwellia sp. HL-MZ19]|uniref:hypothetical protein n=1 Tax=unclassified Pseudocolwellia TaxID=2848178 RepID=UPI003CEAD61E
MQKPILGALQGALFLSKKRLQLTITMIFIALLLIGVFFVFGAKSIAAKSHSESNVLPSTYKLDEVSLTFIRHSGAKKNNGVRKVSISLTTSTIQTTKGDKTFFNYSSDELLKLINTLYRIKFFDLPTHHNLKYSIYLKEDGSVATTLLHMADTSSTTVCFELSTYKKCVTYGLDAPEKLKAFSNNIFSEAEQLKATIKT